MKLKSGIIAIALIVCLLFTACTSSGDNVVSGKNENSSNQTGSEIESSISSTQIDAVSDSSTVELPESITQYLNSSDDIATLASVKLLRDRNDAHKDGAVYTMHVKGGFYLDELIKQGGAKSDAELLAFVSKSFTDGKFEYTINNPSIGCASFTAKDSSGDSLFARSYDFAKSNTCIVFTEGNGNDRHATITTVDTGFVGIDRNKNITTDEEMLSMLATPYVPLDGINDAGVSCGINMSYQNGVTEQNTKLPDITSTLLIRLILDYADNVDEAVEIAKAYDMHDSAGLTFHYQIADASGKSVVIQYVGSSENSDSPSGRKLEVIYSDKDDDIGTNEAKSNNQVITNFIIKPGYYNAGTYKNGHDRYLKIWSTLQQGNDMVKDERAAMDILKSVGARLWYNNQSAVTVHSVVYNLTDKSMLWVPNENFNDSSAYYTFSFN